MKLLQTLLILMLCLTCVDYAKAEPSPQDQATEFFEHYLDLYNQRFGHPENSEMFRSEMAKLMYEPLLQVPPKGSPIVHNSRDAFVKNLEAFVTQLEKLGVVRLRYDQMQLHMLTPNKLIANNIGHGLNEAGEVVYKTISIYLLYRADERWQLTLLHAYDMDKEISIS
ncbi:MAG: hypothetical protein AAF385_03485 [Pseudomonadota bacterium]